MSRLRVIVWFGTLLLVSLSSAAVDQAPGTEPEPEAVVQEAPVTTAPVTLDGTVLFSVRGVSALPAPERAKRVAEIHRSILDVFNEYGVQIMTPAYEGDPEQPKVVPREQWFAVPAALPGAGSEPDSD